MKTGAALRSALNRADLHYFSGYLSHIAEYQFRGSLLSVTGTRKKAGRYHAKNGAPALYFADTPITAIFEVERAVDLAGILVGGLAVPGVIITVEFELDGVLDLTNPSIRKILGTTLQELTGSWMTAKTISPTQRLGEAAHRSGRITAIKAPSAAHHRRGAYNLVVFRDRVRPAHKMEIHDPGRWLGP